jgi:transposase
VFHDPVDVDLYVLDQSGSLPTKATAIRAAGDCCEGDRSRTQFCNGAISGHAVQPGRPLAFDRAIYARRNVAERCINRLKQWRGLATRYEKRAVTYRAMVVIASMVIWLDS